MKSPNVKAWQDRLLNSGQRKALLTNTQKQSITREICFNLPSVYPQKILRAFLILSFSEPFREQVTHTDMSYHKNRLVCPKLPEHLRWVIGLTDKRSDRIRNSGCPMKRVHPKTLSYGMHFAIKLHPNFFGNTMRSHVLRVKQ